MDPHHPSIVERRSADDPDAGALGPEQLPGHSLEDFCPDSVEAAPSLRLEIVNNGTSSMSMVVPHQAPRVVIAQHDDADWRNFTPSPAVENRTDRIISVLGTTNHATLYRNSRRGPSEVPKLENDSQDLVSIHPYPNSQEMYALGSPLVREQIFMYTQYRTTTREPCTVTAPSVGDSTSISLYRCGPKMSRNASSSESSGSVAPTPGSQSDRSFPFDEGMDEVAAKLGEGHENNVSHGPCSKEWRVPPRIRRKRQTKNHVAPKPASKKPEGYHRRGPFKEDWKRRNTALTRKLKCCIRCRMMRIRCEPDDQNLDGDCGTCQRAKKSKVPIMCRLPCLRWKITDASLYREQDMPCQLFSKRWQSMDLVDITEWASNDIKVIQLSQIDVNAPYPVEVRRFVPVPGDMLESVWTSGHTVKRHRVPIYAIADMKKVAQTLVRFTNHYVPVYIHSTIGEADLLFWRTYYFAFHHQEKAKTAREKRLMSGCLRFWVACRKISHSERIYSSDTLGGQAVGDPDSPYYNIVPIPAIMKAQMECIMYTTILRPLKHQVLTELKELIMENRREHWLTIYLTLFILLHNCAMLTRRDWQTARQYRLKQEYANLSSIKEMQAGMMTMLAHFHYLNKGVLPFHLTYDDKDLQKLSIAADLDTSQLEFVRETSLMVNAPKKVADIKWTRENRMFGDDLYWVSQLYDDNWTPGPTVA